MILRDGLLGTNDYPAEMPVMQPPPRPVVDEATPEQMTAWRQWLRDQGFVTREWEKGEGPKKVKPVVKPQPVKEEEIPF